ncbi:cation diffusion facilitator family transporter [Neptuniibacter sp. CAU 1671]|uniref:cation diffusion facilitator family transporter n=1 Tax=Neptuniibacter sp. CAU 1671 TaxID=3032593 RepID=UPI0023DAF899|nr:cation diffusion facilitator family transporter [Neptuniibacter sp. CAU 1671]MDF2182879.1 cation diffusion facilitator family transporter [Neptuniibacter sp. CAU 1671]
MHRHPEHTAIAAKVTLQGALLDAVLGVMKIVTGVLSHSTALVADGIHSLSDLLTDALVLIVLRFSGQAPDEDHPWGHARFETVGTVILGSVLIAVAGAMAYDSLHNLLSGETLSIPQWPALLVAALSIVGKEWIFRYTLKVGKEIKSDMIIANAWHSRSDAFSSVVVLIGVAGAMMGWIWLDAVAAVVVALLVGKIGWDLTWDSLRQLVDTGLPPEEVERLKTLVMSVDGVINVHSFKSRSMGSNSLLEMHIQVAPFVSASEGHQIGDNAMLKLLKHNEDIGHIIYHIDTYDDAKLDQKGFFTPLPMRSTIEPDIERFFAQCAVPVKPWRVTLHYRKDLIDLEILLLEEDLQALLNSGTTLKELIAGLRDHLEQPRWFGKVYLGAGQID